MKDERYFKYYYSGAKSVPIVISSTQSMVVEAYSEFTIPASAQGELSKVTRHGNVRFVSMVAPPQKAKSISHVNRVTVQNEVQKPPRRQPIIIKSDIKPFPHEEIRGEKQEYRPNRTSVVEVNFNNPVSSQQSVVNSKPSVSQVSESNIEAPVVDLVISSDIKRTSNELRKGSVDTKEVISGEKIEIGVDIEDKNREDIKEITPVEDETTDEVVVEGNVPTKVSKTPARRKKKASSKKK